MLPERITGTIHLTNGEQVEFQITAEHGWQQWGNVNDVLYETMPLLEAVTAAANEYLHDGEGDDAKREELARLEREFEAAGGRGVDLAERIDELRDELGEVA